MKSKSICEQGRVNLSDFDKLRIKSRNAETGDCITNDKKVCECQKIDAERNVRNSFMSLMDETDGEEVRMQKVLLLILLVVRR